jgi:hypothetical protein
MPRRISNRCYPEMECSNPECQILFTPHDRRQIFCEDQCRVNYYNDKRHANDNSRFADEKIARLNNKILAIIWKKVTHLKKKIVQKSILEWEGFRFDSQVMITKNAKTGNNILWYYDFGLELVDTKDGLFEIHNK